MVENDDRSIEGTALSLTTPDDPPIENTFMRYISMYIKTKVFVVTMAPFVNQCVGPGWFRNRFVGFTLTVVVEGNAIWETFLTLQFCQLDLRQEHLV